MSKTVNKTTTKTKTPTKKSENKLLNKINTPKAIIIFLIVMMIILSICFVSLKKKYKFYAGQISDPYMAVGEIHYYSEPTMTYFFANNAVYGGEDKKINSIDIKYVVTVNNKEIIIDESKHDLEKPQGIIESIMIYSKFKVVDLKGKTNTIFTDEVKKNINTLKLVVDADDIHLEYPVTLTKLK